jgi:sporulation protein YlmC with PRC-barrel domain
MGEGSTRTLMGLLAPVILGVLGREQRAAGLEGSAIARMLTAQKDQIAGAMPPDLADLLDSESGPRDRFDATSRSEGRTYDAPQATHTYARDTTAGIQRAISEPKEATLGSSWPYWVLPLLAAAGLLWYLLPSSEPSRQATETTTKSATVPAQFAPRLIYLTKAGDDAVAISTYFNQDIYNRAGEKLGTIKDLLVAPDGKVTAAVIGVGGFLGIGEKDIAVPLNVVQLERRNNVRQLIIDVTREALKTAPAFEPVGDRTRLQPNSRQ